MKYRKKRETKNVMYVCCMHRPVCLRAQPFKLFNNNVSMQPRRCFFGLFFIVGFFHHFSLESMSLSALFAFFPFSLYLFRSFTLCASFVAFLVCARRALSSYIVLLLLFHTIFFFIYFSIWYIMPLAYPCTLVVCFALCFFLIQKIVYKRLLL